MLAEVRCRRCKTAKFVPWEFRHAGKDTKVKGHTVARCSPCPSGSDITDFTGHHKFEEGEEANETDIQLVYPWVI